LPLSRDCVPSYKVVTHSTVPFLLQHTSAVLRAAPELLSCPSPPDECMLALARVLVPPLDLTELAGLLTAYPGGCMCVCVLLLCVYEMLCVYEIACFASVS